MSQRSVVRPCPLAVSLSLALLLSAPAMAQQSIDRVFGGIEAESGQEYGALETVNGGIRIRDQARVRSAETVNGGVRIGHDAIVGDVETVNGGIKIGNGSRVRNAETVNGGIALARAAQVEGDAETVNGAITGAAEARIGDNVETVNGSIRLSGVTVGGNLTTTHGDIELDAGTVINGELRVEKPSLGWWNTGNRRDPRVVLGANVVVKGPLVFEREVDLRVHPSAQHGPITGATAKPLEDVKLENE